THLKNRGNRHCQEHAENAEQLAADEEHNDCDNRVEPNLFSDDPWGDYSSLNPLNYAEPPQAEKWMEKIMEFQGGKRHGEKDTDDGAEVRNDEGNPCQGAGGDCQIDADEI